jgi:hypothetical protein
MPTTNSSPSSGSDQRKQLRALGVEEARESQLFKRIAELGKEFEAALLALLFYDPELRRWVLTTGSSERPDQTGTAFRMAA